MIVKFQVWSISLLVLLGTSCTWEKVTPKVDCSLSPVEIELLETINTSCGASDGAFSVNATGGEPPYSYIANTITTTDGLFENVTAGTYAVVVSDAKGCSSELNVTVQNTDGANIDGLTMTQSGCGSTSGSIQIAVSGGVEPYFFSLNGQAQQSNLFTGLGRGNYEVKIQDQIGCEIIEKVTIPSGISYENSVKAIIQNNCAVSGCHNGSISPDFRSFSTIQSRASAIKSRTQSKSMPRGSSLSQSQIDMIACWVDDGALQN